MTTRKKKPFWTKLLSALLIASMLVGTAGTSSYAAAGDPGVVAEKDATVSEDSATDGKETTGTPAEQPATDAGKKDASSTDKTDTSASKTEASEDNKLSNADGTQAGTPEKKEGEASGTSDTSDADKEQTALAAQKKQMALSEQKKIGADEELKVDDSEEEKEEVAPTYATVEDFLAAVDAVGDVEEEEELLPALDNCISIYNKLSPEDQEAQSEAYDYIVGYREEVAAGNPDEGIEALANKDYTLTARVVIVDEDNYIVKFDALSSKNWTGTTDQTGSYIGDFSWSPNGKLYKATGHSNSTNVNVDAYVKYPTALWNTAGYTYVGWISKNSSIDREGTYVGKLNSTVTYDWMYESNRGTSSQTIHIANSSGTYLWYVFRAAPKTYKLTYDMAGGTPQYDAQSDTNTNGTWTTTVNGGTPTKDNYDFDGWQGSDGKTYQPGDSITLTGDVTLTAQWKPTTTTDNGNGISITKKRVSINDDTSKTIAEPGNEITWEIVVTNNSNVTKTVTLTEKLAGASLSESNFTLTAGASKTVTATYTVTGKETLKDGMLFNTVAGTTGDSGENENPEATDGGTEVDTDEEPNISVEKTPVKTEYIVGEDVSWNIIVTNNGNSSVSGLKLVDELKKDGVTFTGVKIEEPTGLIGTKDSFTLESKKSVTFKAKIEDAAAGTYSNKAIVKTDSKDLDEDTAADVVVKSIKTVDRPLTFSIVFWPEGSGRKLAQSDVPSNYKLTLTYTDGEGISYVKVLTYAEATMSESSGSPMLTWDPITIKVPDVSGAKVKINVKQENYIVGDDKEFTWKRSKLADGGKMEEGTGVAYVSRISSATTVRGDNYYKDATTTLKVTKTADKDKVSKGDTVVYTINVENTGSNVAKDVKVTDSLPSGLELVTSGENGPKLNGTPITSVGGKYTIGDLAVKGAATLVLTAKVTAEAGTEIVNTATASYDNKPTGEFDPTGKKKIVVTEKKQYVVKVQYVDDDKNVLKEEFVTLDDGEKYDVSDMVLDEITVDAKHYIKDGDPDPSDALTGTISGSDVKITIPYTLDDIGTDPDDPDKGDNVPDKYQVVVTYRAVNGTVTGAGEDGTYKTVLTLTNDDAISAENPDGWATAADGGSAVLPAAPTTAPNAGYGNGTWDITPTTGMEISENKEFVITYTANPTTPTTPTTPPGGGGGGGGGGTDPTPTPPTPEITRLIPEIIPAGGPATTPAAPTVTPVAATPAPTPTAALTSPTPEAVAELQDDEVPLAGASQPEMLEDEEVPLAGGGEGGAWALINFALMNLAIFESLMLLIGYFVKTQEEEDEEKRKLKKKGLFRIISLPIAIISLIVFILTEDITLPTAFVDKYTIVMLIIAIVQTVMVALSKKKYEDEEEQQGV